MITQDDCVSLEKMLSMNVLLIKIQQRNLKERLTITLYKSENLKLKVKTIYITDKYELTIIINTLHAFGIFKASGI